MSDHEPNAGETRTQAIRAKAADWLIEQRDSEGWSPAKQAEFDAWLDETPAHRIAYLRLDATWSRADRLAALRPSEPQPKALAPALIRIAMGVAAAVVIAFTASRYFAEPAPQSFATRVGGHKTVVLSDGSQIELNTDTVLRFSARSDARTAWLDRGEAYFDIKHDAARPFIVNAGSGRVIDIGTKFSVRRDANRVDVALVEGKARFVALAGGAKGQSAELTPGDKVIATAFAVSKTHAAEHALKRDLSWRQGVLTFDNMTLNEVAATFNRYNSQKLVIAGADVGRLTVVGTFRTDGVARFSRVTRDILGLQTTHHGNEIIISR